MKDNSIEALILNIITVVLRTHFYYITDRDLQQDLMQEGYLKAYELLSSGNYDPYRNLRTFIYTGARNAMTNYLYHHKKESHDAIETIDNSTWQQYSGAVSDRYYEHKVYYYDEPENTYTIDESLILDTCSKYSNLGDYSKYIKTYFSNIGLYSTTDKVDLSPVENSLIFDAIKCEILWNIFTKNKQKEF